MASTSKIRQTVLKNAGVQFQIHDPAVEETSEHNNGASPRDIAITLARQKSEKVSANYSETLCIGADQTLDLAGQLFNKPGSKAAARTQLLALRNKIHYLNSAISCSMAGKEIWNHCATAELKMRDFSAEFLETYLNDDIDSYVSSVGGYKIEGPGIQLFEEISGDYFTILGLPLLPLLEFLRQRHIVDS